MSNESASISRWIINLGGGEDPSWASSIVRTIIAIAGTYAFVEYNISYGYLTYPAKLATSVLATIFAGSLVVKIVKSSISYILKEKRMKRAEQHWVTLSSDERTVIAKFMTEKRKRLQLKNNDPHELSSLVDSGILKDVAGLHSHSNIEEPAPYELSEGMWHLALEKWETETFRDQEQANRGSEESEKMIKILKSEKEADKNRLEQLENEIYQLKRQKTRNELFPKHLHGKDGLISNFEKNQKFIENNDWHEIQQLVERMKKLQDQSKNDDE